MSVGWLDDLSEANEYFETERLETSAWESLTDDAKKEAALKMAYKRIYYCSDFNIPASPSATLLAKLKDAQCEMAYYLAVHLADEDRRKGLQAQGVTGAGIVKETYEKDWLNKLPIPPIVYEILSEIYKYSSSFAMIEIDRDEDESIDEDVVS